MKNQISSKKLELSRSYFLDGSNKDSVITIAQGYLFEKIVDKIFPSWYNTKWSFNGTTTVPKKGSIACGYFVTTVLEDAGFKIPRVKWARLPSETMILKLNRNVKRFRQSSVDEAAAYIYSSGKGIYIIGLDVHVGFIVNDGVDIMFVHSNYYKPEVGVMKESLEGNNPLADSKYRVIGKILHKEMIEKWLKGQIWNEK